MIAISKDNALWFQYETNPPVSSQSPNNSNTIEIKNPVSPKPSKSIDFSDLDPFGDEKSHKNLGMNNNRIVSNSPAKTTSSMNLLQKNGTNNTKSIGLEKTPLSKSNQILTPAPKLNSNNDFFDIDISIGLSKPFNNEKESKGNLHSFNTANDLFSESSSFNEGKKKDSVKHLESDPFSFFDEIEKPASSAKPVVDFSFFEPDSSESSVVNNVSGSFFSNLPQNSFEESFNDYIHHNESFKTNIEADIPKASLTDKVFDAFPTEFPEFPEQNEKIMEYSELIHESGSIFSSDDLNATIPKNISDDVESINQKMNENNETKQFEKDFNGFGTCFPDFNQTENYSSNIGFPDVKLIDNEISVNNDFDFSDITFSNVKRISNNMQSDGIVDSKESEIDFVIKDTIFNSIDKYKNNSLIVESNNDQISSKTIQEDNKNHESDNSIQFDVTDNFPNMFQHKNEFFIGNDDSISRPFHNNVVDPSSSSLSFLNENNLPIDSHSQNLSVFNISIDESLPEYQKDICDQVLNHGTSKDILSSSSEKPSIDLFFPDSTNLQSMYNSSDNGSSILSKENFDSSVHSDLFQHEILPNNANESIHDSIESNQGFFDSKSTMSSQSYSIESFSFAEAIDKEKSQINTDPNPPSTDLIFNENIPEYSSASSNPSTNQFAGFDEAFLSFPAFQEDLVSNNPPCENQKVDEIIESNPQKMFTSEHNSNVLLSEKKTTKIITIPVFYPCLLTQSNTVEVDSVADENPSVFHPNTDFLSINKHLERYIQDCEIPTNKHFTYDMCEFKKSQSILMNFIKSQKA